MVVYETCCRKRRFYDSKLVNRHRRFFNIDSRAVERRGSEDSRRHWVPQERGKDVEWRVR